MGVTWAFGIESGEVSHRTRGFLGADHVVGEQLEKAVHFGDGNAARAEEGHEEAARIP